MLVDIACVTFLIPIFLCFLFQALSTSLPVFHQAVLSSTTKPIPVTAAVMSLISYFRNSVWDPFEFLTLFYFYPHK